LKYALTRNNESSHQDLCTCTTKQDSDPLHLNGKFFQHR
jgi:hypothetical protein